MCTHRDRPQRYQGRVGVWLMLLLALIPMGAGMADAKTIVVTSLADSGAGSLRQVAFNAVDGDVIELPAGTITLTGASIALDDNVTIKGRGQSISQISGGTNDRIFEVESGAMVTISDVTLRDGKAQTGGGAILNEGDLTLTDVTLTNNDGGTGSTGNGGAIHNKREMKLKGVDITKNKAARGGGIYNRGNLRINDSGVNNNAATDFLIGNGGGIYNQDDASQLRIVGSKVNGNTATLNGGGIYSRNELNMLFTEVTSNKAGRNGGGIALDGANSADSLSIATSTISANEAQRDGGGIFTNAGGNFDRNTISNNMAGRDGGGIAYIVEIDGASFLLIDSIISANEAQRDGGGIFTNAGGNFDRNTISNNMAATGNGGGILNGLNTLVNQFNQLKKNTISGNTAFLDGGGIANFGDLLMQNSTLSGNQANTGGGLYHVSASLLTTLFHNTIFNNTAVFGSGIFVPLLSEAPVVGNTIVAGDGNDCFGPIASDGFNLDADGSCFAHGVNNDETHSQLFLDVLRNNGGGTLTHLPLIGSPAVNKIPALQCRDVDGDRLVQDQRFQDRTIEPLCDKGAVEVRGLLLSVQDGLQKLMIGNTSLLHTTTVSTDASMVFEAPISPEQSSQAATPQLRQVQTLQTATTQLRNVQTLQTTEPFACSLNDAPFEPCTSPVTYEDLAHGQHVWRLRLSDDSDAAPTLLGVTWLILTPAEAVEALWHDIQNLVETETLSRVQGLLLGLKLQLAKQQLHREHPWIAIKWMQAFRRHVHTLMQRRVFTSDDGQPLITEANAIMTVLHDG